MFRTPLCPSSGAFSAAHAVSGPVWCLVRCVLQPCCVVAVTTQQDLRTQRTKHHTGPETACAAEKAPDDGHNGVRNM